MKTQKIYSEKKERPISAFLGDHKRPMAEITKFSVVGYIVGGKRFVKLERKVSHRDAQSGQKLYDVSYGSREILFGPDKDGDHDRCLSVGQYITVSKSLIFSSVRDVLQAQEFFPMKGVEAAADYLAATSNA